MSQIILDQIQPLVLGGKIVWTEHVAIRIRERGLKRKDVVECVSNGEIIEQYPTDTPYPSCLISGRCCLGNPLHIVASLNPDEYCCIITAYRPTFDKWENDNKTRKEPSK